MERLENQAQEVDRMQISSCLRLEMEGIPIKGHKETLGNDGNIFCIFIMAMVTQDICIWQNPSNYIF